MHIRSYRESDLLRCRALWLDLTEHHREIYAVPTIGGERPELRFDEHLALVGPEHIWLAVDDEEVVGMVGYMPEEREVEPIVIVRGHRGRGVGELLLKHVMEFARQGGVGRLAVRPAARNIDAIAFFHRAGFTTLGRLELAVYLEPAKNEWRSGAELFGLPFEY